MGDCLDVQVVSWMVAWNWGLESRVLIPVRFIMLKSPLERCESRTCMRLVCRYCKPMIEIWLIKNNDNDKINNIYCILAGLWTRWKHDGRRCWGSEFSDMPVSFLKEIKKKNFFLNDFGLFCREFFVFGCVVLLMKLQATSPKLLDYITNIT